VLAESIRNILIAGETLAIYQFPLLLKWISEHAKINGNKKNKSKNETLSLDNRINEKADNTIPQLSAA
jgi:hypothetical protein